MLEEELLKELADTDGLCGHPSTTYAAEWPRNRTDRLSTRRRAAPAQNSSLLVRSIKSFAFGYAQCVCLKEQCPTLLDHLATLVGHREVALLLCRGRIHSLRMFREKLGGRARHEL